MRVIKFRGWDKKNKIMINHNRFFRLDCSNEEPFLALLENKSFDMEVKIMQYTGLKDCNGIEVYEGDVVENFLTDRFEIKHIEDKARFSIGEDNINKTIVKTEKIKVIGNIYENPELLLEK